MPKVKVEVDIDWAEIRNLIEEKWGLTIIEDLHDIERSGDPDRGDYEERLRSVTCVCQVEDHQILKSSRSTYSA
jgi:hypothetical protein